MHAMKYENLAGGGKIPLLGLGTWRMGGSMSPEYSQDDHIIGAIRSIIELGCTHIDTAEMYGGGHTEELIGRAIRGFNRQDLFITTKVWQSHLRYQQVLNAINGSLNRLGIDYVDLYLIHWPNASVPLEDTFRGLNEIAARGLSRHIGVSNFDLALLKRARQLCETPLATNQVPYSIRERRYVHNGVVEYCQSNGIVLTAYSPIDKGVSLNNPDVRRIAAGYGATPAQVALSWLIHQPQVIAIPKTTNPEHMAENLGALELELSPADKQRLDKVEMR